MKLSIERQALLKALAHAQNVVERRTTIPILANVLLEARDGGLGLTATDMDLSIRERSVAEVLRPGATTVAAHTLYDIVRKLPDGSVVAMERAEDGTELTVQAGRITFELPVLPAEDFPAMGKEDFGHRFTLPAKALIRLIDKTAFAISTEETRYYLNGIFLHAVGQGPTRVLRAVATDGHRLARAELALPEGADGMPPVIVPRKTVGEVRKLIEESDDDVAIGLSPTRIEIVAGEARLVSRLIDGTFPDYERVIPTGNDKVMVVQSRPLKDAVDRVATISTDKSRAVKLAIEPGRLVVSVISPDSGRGHEELDVGYTAEHLEIGFNARYILDMMGQIEGDEVELEMASAAQPTVVRDPKDTGLLYVLMPMRV
jgi:DNA polymerase III subunit beta